MMGRCSSAGSRSGASCPRLTGAESAYPRTMKRSVVLTMKAAVVAGVAVAGLLTSCGDATDPSRRSTATGAAFILVTRPIGSVADLRTSHRGTVDVRTGTGRFFTERPGWERPVEALLVAWAPFVRLRADGDPPSPACGDKTWLSGASLLLPEMPDDPLAIAARLMSELSGERVQRRIAELDIAEQAQSSGSGTATVPASRLGIQLSGATVLDVEFNEDAQAVGATWESQAPSELGSGSRVTRAESTLTIAPDAAPPIEQPDGTDVCDGATFDPLAGLD